MEPVWTPAFAGAQSMITFTFLVWIWKGSKAAGRWYFVTVPEEQSAEIKAHSFGSPRGFNSVKVEATIGDVTWRTSVFPLNRGGYVLPVKAEVRRRAKLSAGDKVSVGLRLI
jgi:hypothetical protein